MNSFATSLRFLLVVVGLAVSTFAFARVARADTLYCPAALNTDGFGALYRWDELSSVASQELYLDFEACSCGTQGWTGGPATTLGPCSDACSASNSSNDWICGIAWPVDNVDWTQAQADACSACVATTCAAESNACNADGTAAPTIEVVTSSS